MASVYIPRSESNSLDNQDEIQDRHTSEWIDRDQDRANVGVYLSIRPTFLEIVIYTFIADSRQQGHIRDAGLFLLETFLPIGLHFRIAQSMTSVTQESVVTHFGHLTWPCSLLCRRHFLSSFLGWCLINNLISSLLNRNVDGRTISYRLPQV